MIYTNYLIVALGAIFGSTLRFGLLNIFNSSTFAYGTLIANSLGSFLAGVFFVLVNDKLLTHEYRLALIIGFCGSLTTLSAISLDSINLFNNGNYSMSLLNLGINIILSIIFVILGIYLTNITSQHFFN